MAGLTFTPGWRTRLAVESHPVRERAMRLAEDTAVRVCPIDTGALRSTITGEAARDRMDCRLSAGDTVVDYAAVVEVGGRAHIIRSHGPWPLRNRETGQVFGQVVRHPGTPAQPYLRPGVMAIAGMR